MNVTIRTKQATHEIECEQDERILFAGLRCGLALPYECATGTCGTCKARSRNGEILSLWPAAPGQSYLKPERGEFLMCQARAVSACEILVPGRPIVGPGTPILPAWHEATIAGTERLTHDVIRFDIELERPIEFHAGQFMLLQSPGIEGFRAYSMVNYEQATKRLRFVVKKKNGGGFSEWLFGTEVTGSALLAFGPLGRATFHPEEEKNLVCVGGGSGIAGLMSILARGCSEGYFERHTAYVFFGVRTMHDLFFLDELSHFKSLVPDNVHITVALSDELAPNAADTKHPHLAYASGMVHQVVGERMSGAYENTTAFVAGPPPMVDGALRLLILDGRLPADDIRYDKFG
jgi:toluene monooxygenase electron transfer component